MSTRITLDEIVAKKRQWLAAQPVLDDVLYTATTQHALKPAEHLLLKALQHNGSHCHLIAEIKPKSPSAGVLAQGFDLTTLIATYSQFATGISVLTDAPFFNGSFEALHAVSTFEPLNTPTRPNALPTLCKDFVIDPRQIIWARQSGAQAVLLMIKLLDAPTYAVLHQACMDWGMTPVVEVQNEDELAVALTINPQIILVNNRDLSTFDMDMTTSHRLLPQVPPGIVRIAASGYADPAALAAIAPLADAVLMGSHLMPYAHNAEVLSNMLSVVVNGLRLY
jgi:indole-3-glycerol phosphate synthase / phosphoribosylanthranilate isomerase